MLYEKYREILKAQDCIVRNLLELDTVRRALALLDKQCLELSLKDVEILWGEYTKWRRDDYIPINKTWIKRFLKWIYYENNKKIKNEAFFIKCINSLDGIDDL